MSKTDQELLKEYAPVMRFSQGERFFPMKIETYMEKCDLYKNVQFGIVHLLIYLVIVAATAWTLWTYFEINPWWTAILGILLLVTPVGFRVRSWKKETDRAAALGKYQTSNYYLRYTKPEVPFKGCYMTLLVLIALAFFLFGNPLQGFRATGIGLLLFFGFSFLYKSEATIMVFVAFGMMYGLFSLSSYIYSLFQSWNPFCLGIGILLFIVVLIGIGRLIITRSLSFVMALFSQATDEVAERAHREYKEENFTCYSRVIEEQDNEGKWTILQYNYFYAFNDWRLAAAGANNHEGDWEAVSIFLKDGNPEPEGVAFSQHHEGVYLPWKDVNKVSNSQEPYHPLVYVALGSHANYDKYKKTPTPDMWKPGLVQQILYWVDSSLRRTARRLAEQEVENQNINLPWMKKLQEETKRRADELKQKLEAVETELSQWGDVRSLDDPTEADSALPTEFATGDGLRIGASGDLLQEKIAFSGHMLTSERKREVRQPDRFDWNIETLPRDAPPPWIEYPGLWGIKSLLADESGPPGPKWGRVGMLDSFLKYRKNPDPRRRWKDSLKWRRCLLNPKSEECKN